MRTHRLSKPRASCKVDGCRGVARCKGYCNAHYSRLRRHGSAVAQGAIKPRRTSPNCIVEGCNRERAGRAWCAVHYKRWLRYGDTAGKRTPNGEPERFLRETVLTYDGDQCLAWPYSRTGAGYGKIQKDGRTQIVSRVVCEEVYGPPPSSLDQAAHSCHNGHLGCVTKGHLSWKTPRRNLAERDARKWVQP